MSCNKWLFWTPLAALLTALLTAFPNSAGRGFSREKFDFIFDMSYIKFINKLYMSF